MDFETQNYIRKSLGFDILNSLKKFEVLEETRVFLERPNKRNMSFIPEVRKKIDLNEDFPLT